jgi:electron transfer flavoprotein alpha subunit
MNQDIWVFIEHEHGQVTDITYMMLDQARQIAKATAGQVCGILPGYQQEALAQDLAADQILYIDHPSLTNLNWDACQQILSGLIKDHAPRLVLLGDTTIGADLAGVLSAQLNIPLVSYCQELKVKEGQITATSQICGGKMMAETVIPAVTTLVMQIPGKFRVDDGKSSTAPTVKKIDSPAIQNLRVDLKQFIEPPTTDIDITQQPILVSVGRGLTRQDDLEIVEDLADALNTVVSSSRPIVDQGWLPTSRLVGRSGKTVKPKVYLAVGISGAPEHKEAITGSEKIIAVNIDPNAPIFDIAAYGTTIDLYDLLPVLAEKIREKKGSLQP